MRSQHRGFTLVELLVVVAIIAVLAAILFPIFSRAKEQGRISTCSSNMRQMYNALAMYTDSWGGFMPPSMPINSYGTRKNLNEDPDPRQIHVLLRKYTKTEAIFHCPSDSEMPPMRPSGPGGPLEFDEEDPRTQLCSFPTLGSSYQWRLGKEPDDVNHDPNNNDLKTTSPLTGKALSGFPQPSKLAAARDAQPWHLYRLTHGRQKQNDPIASGNVLYLDGHIQFVHGGEFLAGIY